MDYEFLNEPTKVIVRKLFIALAKKSLALIRGKFSGRLSIMDAEANLDYSMLASQAESEYNDTIEQLNKRLERMSPYNQLQQQAALVDNMSKILAGHPMKIEAI